MRWGIRAGPPSLQSVSQFLGSYAHVITDEYDVIWKGEASLSCSQRMSETDPKGLLGPN